MLPFHFVKHRALSLAAALVALSASCAATGSISSYRSGDLIIYSGTNYNSKTIADDHCATATEKAMAVLDFPGSFLLDTAALPFSISLQLVAGLAQTEKAESRFDWMSYYDRERLRRGCGAARQP